MKTLNDLYKKGVSRRNFMTGAGALGAAAVITGCSSSGNTALPTPTPPVAGYTDADILNFALNLEYLEAEFYLRAATGSGLSATDAGTGAAAVTGGAQVTFTSTVQQQYAIEIAQDELNHVRLIRSALGSAAVARPAIDLTFFGPLAIAAGITTSTAPAFNPFADQSSFLVGAFVFEDVGVTAYTGAAPLLVSSSILNTAAGIQAVEAYHAAEIRTILAAQGALTGNMAYVTAANQVAALRATLSGGAGSLSAGAETSLSTSQIVNCDANGLAFSRTTDQVLHIVYGKAGAGVASGGFFPAGLNGYFKTTAS